MKGQESLNPNFFPTNKNLQQVNGITYDDNNCWFVSTDITNTRGRIMRPNRTTTGTIKNTVNFWIGSNQCNLDFDLSTNKFFFKFLHMPIYKNTNGQISTTYQNDTDSNQSFFAGKNSGLTIANFGAIYSDSEFAKI